MWLFLVESSTTSCHGTPTKIHPAPSNQSKRRGFSRGVVRFATWFCPWSRPVCDVVLPVESSGLRRRFSYGIVRFVAKLCGCQTLEPEKTTSFSCGIVRLVATTMSFAPFLSPWFFDRKACLSKTLSSSVVLVASLLSRGKHHHHQ